MTHDRRLARLERQRHERRLAPALRDAVQSSSSIPLRDKLATMRWLQTVTPDVREWFAVFLAGMEGREAEFQVEWDTAWQEIARG